MRATLSADRELRRFALTVGPVLAAVAAWQLWRDHPRVALAAGVAAVAILVAGVAFPRVLGPVRDAWMALAHAMSRVTTPVMLAAIYFLVVTPLGLVLRLAGKAPLRRARGAPSYWEARPPGGRRSDLRRQF